MPIDPVERFEACCAAFPDRNAVVIGGRATTFSELSDIARRIGALLSGYCPGPRVGIYLSKSAETYASFFGTLAAGGFYTPLNTDAPTARNARILAEFAPDVILTSQEFERAAREAGSGAKIVLIEDLPKDDRFTRRAGQLAYVIFTSGSTGIPKGVKIPRSALGHYLDWIERAFDIREGDRWSQHPNIGFDLSVLDIYGALTLGATLYPLVTNRQALMPALFIRDHQITIWNSVPSVVDLMERARQITHANLSSLRMATFCGEPLLARQVKALFAAKRDLVVQNTYGPTEATVSCSEVILSPRKDYSGTIEIGDPIPGMAFLLARDEVIVPLGEEDDEGELLIVGPQLANGYWNDPEQTARSFVEIPYEGGMARAYRTGDWVEIRAGQVLFRGRIDDQVKLRGYRLELDEVDAAVFALGMGISCTVKVGEELHTFFESEASLEVDSIVAKLRTLLPDHAIPAAYSTLPILPRNANDKLDRLALAALAESSQGQDVSR